jgi:hypothetical protein
MASLPLLLAYQINTAIVIPAANDLPPTLFKDENGNEFIWNDLQSKYEPNTSTLQSYCSPVAEQQNTLQRI